MRFTQEHVGRKWTLPNSVHNQYWTLLSLDGDTIIIQPDNGTQSHSYYNSPREWELFVPLPYMPEFIGPRLLKPVKGQSKVLDCIPF